MPQRPAAPNPEAGPDGTGVFIRREPVLTLDPKEEEMEYAMNALNTFSHPSILGGMAYEGSVFTVTSKSVGDDFVKRRLASWRGKEPKAEAQGPVEPMLAKVEAPPPMIKDERQKDRAASIGTESHAQRRPGRPAGAKKK